MTHARSEAELVTLRKLAQEQATGRKERMTSVHLLAAIASREGPACDLLRERRLDAEALLKATRSFDEDSPDPIGRAMTAARDLSTRSPLPEPSALHLLIALLADRRSAAHRALLQSGVDVARLRTSAMQLALGVVTARRASTAATRALPAREVPSRTPRPAHRPLSPLSPAVAIPIFPPFPTPRASRPSRVEAQAPVDTEEEAAPIALDAAPVAAPRPAALLMLPRSGRAHDVAAHRRAGGRKPQATAPFTLDRGRFPSLASFGKNLTLAAYEGTLPPVIGRDVEIDRVLDVLAKRHGSSPCLVGASGAGKTSIAYGLAQRFADCPPEARETTPLLIEVLASDLLAGTGARGALAERMATIRAEVRESKGRVLLFLDDLGELFGSGSLDEAASEIKAALARGELSIVGTVTTEDYRKTIEPDPSLSRQLSVVEIEEPSESDAFLMLQRVAEGLGRHHGLVYSDESIASSVGWSVRYLPGRALPDKAVAILDLAGARLSRAAQRDSAGRGSDGIVGPEEVAKVVSELVDVPIERLLETDRDRMLRIEELLAERVVGHADKLARIATILRRNAAGLRGRRPIGSFLLLGPTGVGKTETAKAIAELLFHSPDAMTRLDLSEYAEAHAVARLVGAPPGYVGYEAGGQLTEAVRRRPYQVVLLDEIEKAHRDVLEAFLQVFDEGRLTDGRGRRVDFTNTVLVLTSNLGAAEAGAVRGARQVGFASRDAAPTTASRASDAMLAAARAALPPELYNRLDEMLCFDALGRSDVAEIARRQLEGLAETLAARGVKLDIEEAAIEALLDQGGFDPELGARPMKRAIARLVEAPLAEMILRGELTEGWVALVSAEAGQVIVDAVNGRRRAAS